MKLISCCSPDVYKSSLWLDWSGYIWNLLALKDLLWHFSEAKGFLKFSKKTPKRLESDVQDVYLGRGRKQDEVSGRKHMENSEKDLLTRALIARVPQKVLKHPEPSGDLTPETSPSLFQNGVCHTHAEPTPQTPHPALG